MALIYEEHINIWQQELCDVVTLVQIRSYVGFIYQSIAYTMQFMMIIDIESFDSSNG